MTRRSFGDLTALLGIILGVWCGFIWIWPGPGSAPPPFRQAGADPHLAALRAEQAQAHATRELLEADLDAVRSSTRQGAPEVRELEDALRRVRTREFLLGRAVQASVRSRTP